MCHNQLTPHQLRKKSKGLCIEFRCTNKAAKGRKICYKCKSRRYAEANPVKYAFFVLRANAKRRGKEFDLTLDQFKQFCVKTKILLGRGIYKNSLHIDRIDESKGYTLDNVQALKNTDNVKKYREYCYMTNVGSTKIIRYDDDNDLPF